MTAPDLVAAVRPMLDALDSLGVRHYIGGSIASSVHGVPRASIDADVVAELLPVHCEALLARLRGPYYVPDHQVRRAIADRTSFNVVHLDTMLKVDVFVSRARAFDDRAFDRVRSAAVDGGATIPVSSAEDTLLAKLEWFRRGGEVSERQWTDVLGLLAAAGDLDAGYLDRGARELGVADLLRRARSEATGRADAD
jgi:hypothetical protein